MKVLPSNNGSVFLNIFCDMHMLIGNAFVWETGSESGMMMPLAEARSKISSTV